MKPFFAQVWRFLNLPKNVQLFIMRFVNDAFLVGVTGVIVNEKNEILLLKHTYRQTQWSLPGGYLKKGEHPHQGIEREVLEETGLHIKVDKIVKTSHDPTNARLDIICFGIFESGTFVPSAEVIEHGFFHFDTLPEIGKRQKKLIERILKEERGIRFTKNNFFHQLTILFRK